MNKYFIPFTYLSSLVRYDHGDIVIDYEGKIESGQDILKIKKIIRKYFNLNKNTPVFLSDITPLPI